MPAVPVIAFAYGRPPREMRSNPFWLDIRGELSESGRGELSIRAFRVLSEAQPRAHGSAVMMKSAGATVRHHGGVENGDLFFCTEVYLETGHRVREEFVVFYSLRR